MSDKKQGKIIKGFEEATHPDTLQRKKPAKKTTTIKVDYDIKLLFNDIFKESRQPKQQDFTKMMIEKFAREQYPERYKMFLNKELMGQSKYD